MKLKYLTIITGIASFYLWFYFAEIFSDIIMEKPPFLAFIIPTMFIAGVGLGYLNLKLYDFLERIDLNRVVGR